MTGREGQGGPGDAAVQGEVVPDQVIKWVHQVLSTMRSDLRDLAGGLELQREDFTKAARSNSEAALLLAKAIEGLPGQFAATPPRRKQASNQPPQSAPLRDDSSATLVAELRRLAANLERRTYELDQARAELERERSDVTAYRQVLDSARAALDAERETLTEERTRFDEDLRALGMLRQLPEGSGAPRWDDDADGEPSGRSRPGIRNRTIVDATAVQLDAERFLTPKLDELLDLLRELTAQTEGAASVVEPSADATAARAPAASASPEPEPAPSPEPEVERVSSSIVNVLQEELERSTEALLAAANALRGIDDEDGSNGD